MSDESMSDETMSTETASDETAHVEVIDSASPASEPETPASPADTLTRMKAHVLAHREAQAAMQAAESAVKDSIASDGLR